MAKTKKMNKRKYLGQIEERWNVPFAVKRLLTNVGIVVSLLTVANRVKNPIGKVTILSFANKLQRLVSRLSQRKEVEPEEILETLVVVF